MTPRPTVSHWLNVVEVWLKRSYGHAMDGYCALYGCYMVARKHKESGADIYCLDHAHRIINRELIIKGVVGA